MGYLVFAADYPTEIKQWENVAAFFARRGHRTEVLDDAREVWRRIHEDEPDVLISSYVLPYHDGFELGRELRACHPERKTGVLLAVPLVAETAYWVDVMERFHQEIDGLIIKPYTRGRKDGGWRISYYGQLLVTIGHLLYRLGLEPVGKSQG